MSDSLQPHAYLHVNATELIVCLLLEALGTHFSGNDDINCYNYQHFFDPLPTQRRQGLLSCSSDPSRSKFVGAWQIYSPGRRFPGSRSSTLSAPRETPVRFQTTSGRGAPGMNRTCTPFHKQVNPFWHWGGDPWMESELVQWEGWILTVLTGVTSRR